MITDEIKEALKSAHYENDYEKQIQLLQDLCDQLLVEYQQRCKELSNDGQFDHTQIKPITDNLIKASIFLNAALVIYRRKLLKSEDNKMLTEEEYIQRTLLPYDELTSEEQRLIDQIQSVEKLFRRVIKVESIKSKNTCWNQTIQYKDILENIRNHAQVELDQLEQNEAAGKLKAQEEGREPEVITQERVETIRRLYHEIANGDLGKKMLGIKGLIAQLTIDCQTILGEPPENCQFTVIGLGSLAKEEMTPYSDLEFAILIEKKTDEIKRYFYHLSILMNLKIMALGETAIPFNLFDINFDEVVKPGFQLDFGGKTPIGRLDQDYDLIQTPDKMVGYVKRDPFADKDAFKLDLLPIELTTFKHIEGNLDLTKAYREKIKVALDRVENKNMKEKELNQSENIREQRAIELLKKDLNKFDPHLKSFLEEGKLLDVKDEIYRLSNTILEGLSLFYSVEETNSWDKVEALSGLEILNQDGAKRLKNILSIIAGFRLSIYEHYHAQNEKLSALFSLEPTKPLYQKSFTKFPKSNQYKLSNNNLVLFMEIYKTISPLYKATQHFIKKDREYFRYSKLFDERPKTLGKISARLCDYKSAIQYFNRAIILDPENEVLLICLGDVLNHIQSKGAVEVFKKCLSICKEKYSSDHFINGKVLINLGIAYGNLGDVDEEKRLLKKALEIVNCNPEEMARTLRNLSTTYGNLGEFARQKMLLEQALDIYIRIYGLHHVEVAITLMNLGIAYGSLGNAERKKELLERALKILKKFYGTNHRIVAFALTNLGNAYYSLGNYVRHKELVEQALEILEKFYDLNKIIVAKHLVSLGTAYANLGKYVRSQELLEKALAIEKQFYGPDHVEISRTLTTLGKVYRKSGRNARSKKLLESALKIEERFYGLNHMKITKILEELCITYHNLGDVLRQKELLEQALNIKENFYKSGNVEIARMLGSLSFVYEDLGNMQQQKMLLERALEMFVKIYGPEHEEVAITIFNLGRVYKALNKIELAGECFIFSHKKFMNYFGSQNNNTYKAAHAIINLKFYSPTKLSLFQKGREYFLKRDYSEAIQIFKLLVEKFYFFYNEDLLRFTIPNYLAQSYLMQGKLELAIDVYEKLLANVRQHELEENVLTIIASASHNLAYLYHVRFCSNENIQDKQRAEDLFEQAIAHSPTMNKYVEYAHFLYHQEEYLKAKDNLIIALGIEESDEKEDDELTYSQLEKQTLDDCLQSEIEKYDSITVKAKTLAYYLMISCCHELKQPSEVEKYLKEFKIIVEKNNDALSYRLLGYIHKTLGNDDEVELCMAIALSLDEGIATEESASVKPETKIEDERQFILRPE